MANSRAHNESARAARIASQHSSTLDAMNDSAVVAENISKILAGMEVLGMDTKNVTDAMVEQMAQGLRASQAMKRWGFGIVRTDEYGQVDASELHTASIVRGTFAAALTQRMIAADERCKATQYLGRFTTPEEAKILSQALVSPLTEIALVKKFVAADKSLTRQVDLATNAILSTGVTADIERDVTAHVTENLPKDMKTVIGKNLESQKKVRATRAKELARTRDLLRMEVDNPADMSESARKELAVLKMLYPKATPAPKAR